MTNSLKSNLSRWRNAMSLIAGLVLLPGSHAVPAQSTKMLAYRFDFGSCWFEVVRLSERE